MPDIPPFILRHPELTLTPGGAGTPVVLRCQGRALTVEPEQDENDFETFCGTYTTYGVEKWTITLGCYTSFGTEGLWTLVRPLVGTIVDFELLPNGDAAASIDNPIMTGKAMVKAFPFIDAEVSDASEVDVEFAVQGTPTFATTPPAAEPETVTEPEPEPAY